MKSKRHIRYFIDVHCNTPKQEQFVQDVLVGTVRGFGAFKIWRKSLNNIQIEIRREDLKPLITINDFSPV